MTQASWRWLGIAATALVMLGVVTALLTPTLTRTSLDPDAATPGGARALAELLREQGITVERTTDAERAMTSGASTTLVVAYPALLPRADVRRIELLDSDVILLGPVTTGSGYLGVTPSNEVGVLDREPLCDLSAAVQSGDARTGGFSLTVGQSPQVDAFTETAECFPDDGAPSVVQRTTTNGATHTVLGSADFMTNEWIGEGGNAALSLNLTGAQPTVIWWLPTPHYTGSESLVSLLPDGVWPLLAAVAVIVIALAVWQGRRLGPVVAEPLPVAVLARETTEGRARIYQRFHTRSQAAAHLRAVAADAIITRLGLPPTASAGGVADAVAQSTGRQAVDVIAVLYGPPPEGDQELVTLGRQLAAIEQEVRRA